jgi:hypothetical protein
MVRNPRKGVFEPLPMAFVRGDVTDHHIGMAADIFCGRLYRQIDAMFERIEEDRRGPGVVEQNRRAVLACNASNRRNVLHFERQ